ncbi:unnamed protein product [Clavelina lepadiformis]|uniref:Uncharacterized protein n=1 Tax=Clavelina lepadiformis TaxID=159417 RepID=A0ABP0GE45_CLALP
MTGGNFESFLQNKIHNVSNDSDADHVIRRALSTCRLCFEEISDGMEQVDQRLCEVIGKDWRNEYLRRNNEEPRMEKSNTRSRK